MPAARQPAVIWSFLCSSLNINLKCLSLCGLWDLVGWGPASKSRELIIRLSPLSAPLDAIKHFNIYLYEHKKRYIVQYSRAVSLAKPAAGQLTAAAAYIEPKMKGKIIWIEILLSKSSICHSLMSFCCFLTPRYFFLNFNEPWNVPTFNPLALSREAENCPLWT